MYAQKRDANERGLIDLWEQVGCYVIQMDKCAGYDLNIARAGKVYIVEVKDPAKPPSARRLTDRELSVKQCFEAHGVTYHVITTPVEAMAMIGVPYDEQLSFPVNYANSLR